MSAKYLNISHPQKFTSAKNLESFPFFKKSLLHVDIWKTPVIEQSLEVYLKIPPNWELLEYFFSIESGFP